MKSVKPNARTNDLVIQIIKDETLIFDLKNTKVFCLNESAALIWNLCDGKRSIAQIAEEMSRKMKNPVDDNFVKVAIGGLYSNHLLEENSDLENLSPAGNRREMIRKVGATALIALPLIQSVVAPPAAAAASTACETGLLGQPCTDYTDCCSEAGLTVCITLVSGFPAVVSGPGCCVTGVNTGVSQSAELPGTYILGSNSPQPIFCGDANICANYQAANCCSGMGVLVPGGGGACTAPPGYFGSTACLCT